MDILSEWGFQSLVKRIQDGVFVIKDSKIVYANSILSLLLGYPNEEIIGKDFSVFIADEDREMVQENYRKRLNGLTIPSEYTFKIMRKDGILKTVSLQVGIVEGTNDTVGTIKDITHMEETINEIERLKNNLEQIIRKLPDIYYRTDMNGILLRLSPSVTGILGYDTSEVLGTPITDYYVNSDERAEIIKNIFEARGETVRVEAPLLHKDGHEVWFSTNAYLLMDELGNPVGIEGLARDDTRRKKLEEELRLLSITDPLTGLFNRRHIFERAEEEFERAKRYSRIFSIMTLDLDHFKNINDTCGHIEGDRALKEFSKICRESMRGNDLPGRIGGEEFMIVLPETGEKDARQVAERIRKSSEEYAFVCKEQRIPVLVSIGISTWKENMQNFEEMRFQSDRALYTAKNNGRNQIVIL